jgi:hypothetical protein
MAGIFERITSLAGTEAAKAINLAHDTYTSRMQVHGHTGRALVETVAEVCRNHPNLVGIGAGLLVEQLLVEEKRLHDSRVAAAAAPRPVEGQAPPEAAESAPPPAAAGPVNGLPLDHPDHPDHHINFPHLHAPEIRLSRLRPGRVAAEVFGTLILLKLGAWGSHLFRRRRRTEVWFAPVSRIHLLSATLAAYYFVRALRSPKLSAWRNAAVALFATDAIKPLLKAPKGTPKAALAAAPATLTAPPPVEPTPPPPALVEPETVEPAPVAVVPAVVAPAEPTPVTPAQQPGVLTTVG